MEKRVIYFNEVVKEVMKKHGNQWNNKRCINITMLEDEIRHSASYSELVYEPYSDEIRDIAWELYEDGIEDPCLVAVKTDECDDWRIMWDCSNIDSKYGPVLFNSCQVHSNRRSFYVLDEQKNLEDGEFMLTWSHLEECDYEWIGYYTVYKKAPLYDSVTYCDPPVPARTYTFREMAKRLGQEKITLEGMRSLPAITEAELPCKYRLLKPEEKKPCFIMIEDKVLCNSKNAERLPYLYNVEGRINDSYAQREEGDLVVRERTWDKVSGIRVRKNRGHIEDWR